MANIQDNTALLNTYMQLKREEAEAREKRLQIEQELLQSYGDQVAEDRLSATINDGIFQIKIKRNIKWICNEEGWEFINSLPQDLRPVKIDLDQTKAKKMECMAKYLTAHETKPTFEVAIK